uniref:Uncharacterized protein LOC100182110 n=1 Tax=Phallusia mammillata TaxID=59560 RepID=A0A6F9DHT4_9ASCI|nr:uncharacterized protein LOC100182110 [Phallusia mammillata]
MDRPFWSLEPTRNKALPGRNYTSGNVLGSSADVQANSEQIEKKKKIVNDLMALRRMKLIQQNRLRSYSSTSFDLPTVQAPQQIIPPLDKKNVVPLLQGTTLKNELDQAFGDDGLNKAASHFVTLTTEKQRPDSREKVQIQRKQFLDALTKKGRTNLQENRKKRVAKQQLLAEKQLELDDQATAVGLPGLHWRDQQSSPETLSEDLGYFVNETKKKISSMEHHVRVLKVRYADPPKPRRVYASASFELFKSTHRIPVGIASWIIDQILDDVYRKTSKDSANDSELIELLLKSDQQQWDDFQVEAVKRKITVDVLNDLIFESCNDLVRDLCAECFYLGLMSNVYPEDIILENAHNIATGSKERTKKPISKIVEQTWSGVKVTRSRTRFGLWTHSQATIREDSPIERKSPTIQKVATPPPPVVVESGADAEVVSSELAVSKKNSQFGNSPVLSEYALKEFNMWENFRAELPEFSLNSKQSIGISIASPSFDHKLLALGTLRGDILVHDMTWQPARPVRCVSFEGRTTDAIVSIQWSLDMSRLVTLSVNGCVVVWSLSYAPYVTISDLNSLEIEDEDINSQQLTALCVLETVKKDFTFQDGPLVTSTNELHLPSHVAFFPTISFAGTQDSIVVALKNGDMLKCNLSEVIRKRCTEQIMEDTLQRVEEVTYVWGIDAVPDKKVNKIGQEIEVELFRYHRHQLVELCFVKNNKEMVSVDVAYNICTWRHDSEFVNTFGWFTPYKKFKLSLVEEILVPQGADVIRFEDEVALKKKTKGKKTKSKLVVEKERRGVLREIQNSTLLEQKPWHTDEFPDELEGENKTKKLPKLISRIYAPPGYKQSDISAGGATFYLLTYRRETQLLVKFVERVYEPSTMQAVNVLQTFVPTAGDRIYFQLLFNEHLPKVRKHITIIDFDLQQYQLGNIGPIVVNISTENYDLCRAGVAARFSVSRVNQVFGTEYIAFNVVGNLQIYSLLSGRQVVHSPPNKEKAANINHGLILPPKINKINPGSHVLYLNPDGLTSFLVILPLLGNKTGVLSRVLKLNYDSSNDERKELQLSYKALQETREINQQSGSEDNFEIDWFKPEQACVDKIHTLREMPVELYIKMTLNSLLDIAVAKATQERIPQDTRKIVWKRDWERLQGYFKRDHHLDTENEDDLGPV